MGADWLNSCSAQPCPELLFYWPRTLKVCSLSHATWHHSSTPQAPSLASHSFSAFTVFTPNWAKPPNTLCLP